MFLKVNPMNKNDWIVVSREASISDYGKYPGSRSVEELINSGIIILDKPSGPTSHQVDAWIKEMLDLKKASHGGTLDPRVTGVLVIALNKATKLMQILLKSKKEYVGIVHLHKDVPEEDIRRVCDEFIGEITQLPPKKSAVARRERQRTIYYLEILEIDGRDILMRVGCEAGTYIRRLADDIGKKLGTGGHLQELRRTKSGMFDESEVISLQELSDAIDDWKKGNEDHIRNIVFPIERATEGIKNVVVKNSSVDAICNGAPLSIGGVIKVQKEIKKDEWVGMLTLKGELIGVGKALKTSDEMSNMKKGLVVKTDTVVMEKGTYPKMWKKKQ